METLKNLAEVAESGTHTHTCTERKRLLPVSKSHLFPFSTVCFNQ